MSEQLFQPGQTEIHLPAGSFHYQSRQHIPSNCVITGVPGKTLLYVDADADGVGWDIKGDNIEIRGLVFMGGGIFIDKQGGKNENIVIVNNEFRIDAKGPNNNAITCTSGLKNSRITDNLFTGYNCSFAIYGYGRDKLVIANNEFIDINAGIHLDDFDPNDSDDLFEQNYFSGVKGMGIELQSNGARTIVQDNWYEHPNLSPTFVQNNGTMAFSIILDRSVDTIIRRNVVIAPERPDGVGCRIGFEVGGDNCLVEDNYINGINHSIAANDGVGTTSVIARNNLILDQREAPRGRGLVLQGENGPNAKLSWDIKRGRPQRNVRYSTDVAPTILPDSSPVVVPPSVDQPAPAISPSTPIPVPIPTVPAPVEDPSIPPVVGDQLPPVAAPSEPASSSVATQIPAVATRKSIKYVDVQVSGKQVILIDEDGKQEAFDLHATHGVRRVVVHLDTNRVSVWDGDNHRINR